MSSPDIFSSPEPSSAARRRRKRKPAYLGQPSIEPQSPGSSSQTSAGGFMPPSQPHSSSTAQHPPDSGGPSAASGSVISKRRKKKRAKRPEIPSSSYQESPESDVAPTTPGESPYQIPDDTGEPGIRSPLELLRQTFYERLALLFALDPTQGRRAEHAKTPEVAELNSTELRRHFLNAIAYLCDTKKGGKTCTASALQEGINSKILVLASNSTTINPKTKGEVESILLQLSRFDGQHRTGQLLEKHIIQRMVCLSGAGRMQEYLRFLWINVGVFRENDTLVESLGVEFRTILNCIQQLFKTLHTENQTPGDDPSKAQLKLADISDYGLYRAVTQCYRISKSRQMARVFKQQQDNSRELTGPFWDLRHSIGRLAKFSTVAKTLIRTAKVHPQLFPGLEVQVLQNPSKSWGLRPPVLNSNANTDIESTIKQIFMDIVPYDQPAAATYLSKFYRFNEPLERLQAPGQNESVKELFQENYSKFISARGKLTIHAEALMLEHSERTEGFTFVGNDRFIGCSKSSCYLCDQYFETTVPKTETMPTHNKIYLMWRLPDKVPEDEQMEILRGMVFRFGREIKKTLDQRTVRRAIHADSTTGVTSPTYKSDLDSLSMDSFASDVGEASEGEDGGSGTYDEDSDQSKGKGSSKAAPGLDPILRGFGDMRLDMPGSFPG